MILPTEAARAKGLTAIEENLDILRGRYRETRPTTSTETTSIDTTSTDITAAVPALPNTTPPTPTDALPLDLMDTNPGPCEPFGLDELKAEIALQDGSKGCGADGIHIQLLKALLETTLIDHLLY